MHLPAGLIPAGIVDMNTLIFVSQCRTKNTHNLMHAQAGSCTNVKQKHDHGHIVSMLRFGPLVFFNLLPFFNAYDACALNCKVSVFVPGSHVRFTAEDVPNDGGWRRKCFRGHRPVRPWTLMPWLQRVVLCADDADRAEQWTPRSR